MPSDILQITLSLVSARKHIGYGVNWLRRDLNIQHGLNRARRVRKNGAFRADTSLIHVRPYSMDNALYMSLAKYLLECESVTEPNNGQE